MEIVDRIIHSFISYALKKNTKFEEGDHRGVLDGLLKHDANLWKYHYDRLLDLRGFENMGMLKGVNSSSL